MVHAIFYKHWTSGACVGMCPCDCTHQMQKTVTQQQFIQALEMFILWKKIDVYKEKCDCEAITIVVWGLGQSPNEVSGGKAQEKLSF